MSEHYGDCNGNSSAYVHGRRQLDLLSSLCTTLTYHVNIFVIHTRMRIIGRFKGYFLSVHMANLSAYTYRMKVVSPVVVRSQDFRDE